MTRKGGSGLAELTPLFVDMRSRRIIVFGGGQVALRKCCHVKDSEMTVVAPNILSELRRMSVELVEAEIDVSDAKWMMYGFDMVIAATDSKDINNRIRDVAKSAGIPVNSAHGGGDVLFPSILSRKDYTVAVSSNGNMPAFPPFLVEELDGILDESFDNLLEFMIIVRREYSAKWDQNKRSEFYKRILRNHQIRELTSSGNINSAIELARELGESV